MIRTVALPVVVVSPVLDPSIPRPLIWELDPATRSKDVSFATPWLASAIFRSPAVTLEKGIITPIVVGHGRVVQCQHSENDVFSDSVALQVDQAIRVKVEVVRPAANDRDHRFFFETGSHQFDDRSISQRRVESVGQRLTMKRKARTAQVRVWFSGMEISCSNSTSRAMS